MVQTRKVVLTFKEETTITTVQVHLYTMKHMLHMMLVATLQQQNSNRRKHNNSYIMLYYIHQYKSSVNGPQKNID